MKPDRPDAVVRFLNVLLSVLYFAGMAIAVVLFVVIAGVELFFGPDFPDNFTLGVPAAMRLHDVTLTSAWGGTLALTRGLVAVDIAVPFAIAPGWFRVGVYVTALLGLSIVQLFLHNLRQLFRHVGRGAAFDAGNAARVRWLGGLLIVGEVARAAISFWGSLVVLRTVSGDTAMLWPWFTLDFIVILIGLVLIALAEVFRRGTALEDEQALVV